MQEYQDQEIPSMACWKKRREKRKLTMGGIMPQQAESGARVSSAEGAQVVVDYHLDRAGAAFLLEFQSKTGGIPRERSEGGSTDVSKGPQRPFLSLQKALVNLRPLHLSLLSPPTYNAMPVNVS